MKVMSKGCSDSTEDVAAVSRNPLWLRPSSIQTKNVSIHWNRLLYNSTKKMKILSCYPHNNEEITMCPNHGNSTHDFNPSNFALGIKSAEPEDSGCYELEITDIYSGRICIKKFCILILDHVENPDLQGEWKIQADGICQLSLYCSVSKDDNVSFALYRGSKLISAQRNFTYLENQTDSSSLHTYTCNVSNKASWASDTQNFGQGCHSVPPKFTFLPLVVIIVILVLLFLGAVTCFCVRDKKRKQSQSDPKEFLTIYEDVKNPQVRRNQIGHSGVSGSLSDVQENGREQREANGCLFEEQTMEQKPPGDGGTIYSMIQYKPSDSTSHEKCTLYSAIQSSRKSGSKKRNQNCPSSYTVYEEVGSQCLNTRNPARLSRRELENFDVYS
ncbi:natural killer cell receptor 2B4 isoform X2 [Arvicola amphibius]|uniref:natural killer cell receptor 2B4 isoform X2 n=1 Tax=Arvicola amphibius TaxID=1047088 RepID=UPI0018E36764|nr:natural killer cell receptor 2B4 isoform X2 [Arvicola amphibius]